MIKYGGAYNDKLLFWITSQGETVSKNKMLQCLVEIVTVNCTESFRMQLKNIKIIESNFCSNMV